MREVPGVQPVCLLFLSLYKSPTPPTIWHAYADLEWRWGFLCMAQGWSKVLGRKQESSCVDTCLAAKQPRTMARDTYTGPSHSWQG